MSSLTSRLVVAACSTCGSRQGFEVEQEARGVATATCRCGSQVEVVLDRAEKVLPEGQVSDLYRLATARTALRLLYDASVEYLKLHDLEPHELPSESPLRRAIDIARRELMNRK